MSGLIMHWQLSSGWQQMSSAAQQLLDRIIDTRNCIQLEESARIHSLRPNRTALIICQWQTKVSVILGQLGSPLWVVIFGRIPTRVTLDEVRKGAGWCVSGNVAMGTDMGEGISHIRTGGDKFWAVHRLSGISCTAERLIGSPRNLWQAICICGVVGDSR